MLARRVAGGLAYLALIATFAVAGCSAGGNDTAGAGGSGGGSGSGSGGGAGVSGSGGSGGAGGSGGSSAAGGSAGASSGGSAGSGAGGSAGTSSGGSGGGPADAGLDVVFSYDGPVDDGGFNTDASCADVTAKAEPLPLDLYVVLDRSGSMVNASRWVPVKNAMNQFFQSPGAAGIGVAFTMFAHPTQNECAANSYATPLVPMAPLPGNATGQALTLQNMMNTYPSVNGIYTPTVAALTGAVTFAKNHKNANPTHTVVIVLATDGLPGDPNCSAQTAAAVQAEAAAGYTGTPSIRTYVIGIDPTAQMKTNLDSWASAGGGQSFDAATSGGSAQFLAAMQSIQTAAVGCSYNMPQTDAGIVDPGKVSVEYSQGGNPPASTIPKVNNAAACPSGSGQAGWYYDNNGNPTTITLCPTTCTLVQADANAKVEVNLGCLGS